jgi:hypothetical protein
MKLDLGKQKSALLFVRSTALRFVMTGLVPLLSGEPCSRFDVMARFMRATDGRLVEGDIFQQNLAFCTAASGFQHQTSDPTIGGPHEAGHDETGG